MLRINQMTLVAQCEFRGMSIIIRRNNSGKFYIFVNAVCTQKDLTAAELARWFCQAMQGR